LYLERGERPTYITGTNPVWDKNGEGFYYSGRHMYGINYYNVVTEELSSIQIDDIPFGYVVDALSEDSLIIRANPNYKEYDDSCYHFIYAKNANEYISINNSYLKIIKDNDRIIRNIFYLNLNSEIDEYLFSIYDSSQSAWRIASTDFDALEYVEYTDSFFDSTPIWGPRNEIIFFDRRTQDELIGAYELNLNSGNKRKLTNKFKLPEVEWIINCDY